MIRLFIIAVLFILPFTASAGTFLSVGDRAEAVNKQVANSNTYEAYLARKFTAFAEEEVAQHDLQAARSFIALAEEAAAKVGGAK